MYNNQTVPLSSLQQDAYTNLASTYPRPEFARIGMQGYSSLPVMESQVPNRIPNSYWNGYSSYCYQPPSDPNSSVSAPKLWNEQQAQLFLQGVHFVSPSSVSTPGYHSTPCSFRFDCKRSFPYAQSGATKSPRLQLQPSSIEELATQQLQRNEMDGIDQKWHPVASPVPKNYATRVAMTNPVWSSEDVTMILIAMYRVLFQSRPDAPNDMMIQIPSTCSVLLPVIVSHFVPCQLQNGNAVKEAMRQLSFYTQQNPLPPIIRPEAVAELQKRSQTARRDGSQERRLLVYVVIRELDTEDVCKQFYLKTFLRCLFVVVPSAHEAFVKAFTLFFLEQVDLALTFEQSCNVGELSQLIINTRNQGEESTDARDKSVFVYHRQIGFLLDFCARYFIRPFPPVLLNAILSLFRTSIILSSFSTVSKCLYGVVLTQPELAETVARFFVKAWPWKDSSREVLFLRQVECTLFIIPQDAQRFFFSKLFPNIRAATVSPNRFVSLQTLQLLIRIIQGNMSILNSKMVQKLSEALTSLQTHWCDSVRQCGKTCLQNLLLKAELRESSSSDEFRGRSEAFTS